MTHNGRLYQLLFFFSLILSLTVAGQSPTTVFGGKVSDTSGRPLAFATVRVPELEIQVTTQPDGSFLLRLGGQRPSVLVEVSYVGKETALQILNAGGANNIGLRDKSLTLAQVQVSVTRRNGASPSSFYFNRETIEQIQAFSLADVLNNLPGKTVTPPSLQNPQTLTLRTSVNGVHALTNSLGAAVIIDGVRLSNDANMQSRSLSIRGMGSSAISSYREGSFDVPFTGVDLRDIPVDNIESIEVVQGVAPAQYGELTSGAVIINRQAGKTPLQLNTRINEGSTEFSLSKGFSLGSRWGALNTSLTYLNSNNDPRDKIKSYNRVAGGIMWTAQAGRIKNTFSADYNTKLDKAKQDPDDDSWRSTYSESRNWSFANRTALSLPNYFLRQINLRFSYSGGYQDTYTRWLLNGPPKGLANKDTTGVYEGIFLPGAYLAEERVIGRPVNIGASLDADAAFSWGALAHALKFGTDISYSDNKGEGIVVNPDRPRWINLNNQNERPFNYAAELPAIFNAGFFVQDNLSVPVGSNRLKASIGIRYNLQNGYGNLQPRLNVSYPLNKQWELSAGYGISSKSPTLAHRYPAPAWLDIPVLSLYTGQPNQNLFLVYTQKVEIDNSDLKPARSSQIETGLRYSSKKFNSSLFVYMKRDRDGFNSYDRFIPIQLPEYNYTFTPGQPINYFPTGRTLTYAAAGMYVITNGLQSNSYGAEWLMQLAKIKAIQTGITISHAFSYSQYKGSSDLRTIEVGQSQIDAGSKALYGVYRPQDNRNWSLMSKLSTDTHIPGLGFILTFSADIFWAKEQYAIDDTQIPVGYIDRSMQFVAIKNFDPSNTDYNYLKLGSRTESETDLDFVYGNISMRLAKEIRKKIRVTLAVYNFINGRTFYYDPQTQNSISLRFPVNITTGINFKF